jgi:hypothetical protein
MQDIRRARLGQAEEEEDETKAGEPHDLPNRPCPAFGFYGEATDKRTEHWATNSSDTPDREAICLLLRTVHVGDGRAACCECW